jgi:tetratricopeptide (TPR) repeat protein
MVRLDPASAASYNHLAYHHLRAGDLGEALAAVDEALRIQPKYFGALYHRGVAQILRGEFAAAVATWEESGRISGISEADLFAMKNAFERGGWRGYVEEDARQLERLLEEDRKPGRRPSDTLRWGLVQDWAILGETERAFETLERCFEIHATRMTELREDPFLAPLRGDTRYAELERRVGFPPSGPSGNAPRDP